MIKSYLRGHEIEYVNNEWIYSDTKEPTVSTHKNRPCGNCSKFPTDKEHDQCIQDLPDVMNACCGHGNDDEAYVQFYDHSCIRGEKAIEYFKKHLTHRKK